MFTKTKLSVNRVRLIEGISIAAGLATLLTTTQSLMGAKSSNSATDKPAPRTVTMPLPTRVSGIRKVITAEIIGEPDISSDQFERLAASETSLLQALPPLVAQLNKDRACLKIAESSGSVAAPQIDQMRSQLLSDKEALARLMIESQQETSEIINTQQQEKLNRILTNG